MSPDHDMGKARGLAVGTPWAQKFEVPGRVPIGHLMPSRGLEGGAAPDGVDRPPASHALTPGAVREWGSRDRLHAPEVAELQRVR